MDAYLYLEKWNTFGRYLSFVLLGLGLLIVLYHYMRLIFTSDYKIRYDYINKNEIRSLWLSTLFILFGIGVFMNTLYAEGEIIWLLVRVFVIVMLGLIFGVIISNLLKFYYPFYIERRLRRLRYKPRKSPKTGKPMKLLSE